MPRILRPFALVLLFVLAVLAVQPAVAYGGAEPRRVGVAAAPDTEPGPIVKQAFDLLTDRFVYPPNSADMLNGAWDQGLAALKEKGAEGLPEGRPELGNKRDEDWRAFFNAYVQLARAARGKLEKTDLDRAIVRGMASALNEGHTYYLTPDDFRQAQAQLLNRQRYGGVGVSVNEEKRIIEVFEGSPAEAAGLRAGDQFVAVDGKSVEALTAADTSALIRGEPGTPVELTIRRDGTAEPISYRLVRAQVRVDWVSHRVLDNAVGYLRLRSFPTPEAMASFQMAIERFQEADVRALVLDVRGNGGGSVDTGIQVLSRFIRDGPLFQRINRRGGERTVTAFGDYWDRDIPIAVLVDGVSASMSEILAAALKENGVARVIGTRTAGVVAGTNIFPLLDGSGLAVTGEIIKSGRGNPLNGVGVEPDQTVELDPKELRTGHDTQLDAALQYVRQQAAERAAQLAPTQVLIPRLDLPLAA
ncbi:MAG TPA: S41 family peptidase [Chloroflexota bacterium]|nr:S41 family peptidase [Chloroflexota bacterium]